MGDAGKATARRSGRSLVPGLDDHEEERPDVWNRGGETTSSVPALCTVSIRSGAQVVSKSVSGRNRGLGIARLDFIRANELSYCLPSISVI